MAEIEGPWYVTRKACLQYARMIFGRETEEDVSDARLELVEISKTAHFLRKEEGGKSIWRAAAEWQRVGLVVAEGPGPIGFLRGVGNRKPALVAVLSPHRGWKPPVEGASA